MSTSSLDEEAEGRRKEPGAGLASLLLVAVSTVVTCAGCDGVDAAPVRVAAAASLTDVLTEAASIYARTHDDRVELSFDATNRLARQLEEGAPFDLFVSADAAWMDHVAERGLVDRSSRRDLAENALVVVVPTASALTARDAQAFAASSVRSVGVAGDGVPAGRYAVAALEHEHVAEALAPRIVRGGSVRSVLAWVATGEVDAAIVYRTDAIADPRVRVAFSFDASTHPPIVYPAAVSARTPHADAARRFLTFLASDDAAETFERAGFVLP